MRSRFCLIVFFACVCALWTHAESHPLLDKAVGHWSAGGGELAFTQTTRALNDDHTTKYVRVERYDPSRPDEQRWSLLEVNGRPPTQKQRRDIEEKRNSKPRKPAGNPPSRYLDLDNARLVEETDKVAVFEVGILPGAVRFVSLEKLDVRVTVDKATATVDHISAALREPVRVALGLAKLIDVDLDVYFEQPPVEAPTESEVASDSTARVVLSKFGNPVEFSWRDFKEVPRYRVDANELPRE